MSPRSRKKGIPAQLLAGRDPFLLHFAQPDEDEDPEALPEAALCRSRIMC